MNIFEPKTNKVMFESVGINRAPGSLQGIIEKSKTAENFMFLEDKGKYWVFLARGLKPTGGYAVKVTNISLVTMEDGPETLKVFYKYSDPSPDQFVTQIMTYPAELVLIKGLKKKPAEVIFELVQ